MADLPEGPGDVVGSVTVVFYDEEAHGVRIWVRAILTKVRRPRLSGEIEWGAADRSAAPQPPSFPAGATDAGHQGGIIGDGLTPVPRVRSASGGDEC